jgi:acetyl-CoA carboxylase biotin carboxylase subunit
LECRVNAEKPDQNFQPSPGRVSYFHSPGGPGVRVDSHLYSGYVVPSHYDSMVAKIITWGRDRMEAIVRMRRALDETVVEGIHTTIPLHLRLLKDEAFLKGEIHTGYLDAFLSAETTGG